MNPFRGVYGPTWINFVLDVLSQGDAVSPALVDTAAVLIALCATPLTRPGDLTGLLHWLPS